MSTITDLRQKIQDNNYLIREIEKNPQIFIDWKISDLKNKNTIIVAQIKDMRHLYKG